MNIELTRNTHAILRVQPGTREAKPNGQAERSLRTTAIVAPALKLTSDMRLC